MEIRNFNEAEIAEIHTYVANQIPQGILPQLFILTDEPIKKVKIFITIYRIMQGVRDFVEKLPTKNKLTKFLSKFDELYNILYDLLIKLDNTTSEFGKSSYTKKILNTLKTDNNLKVNKLINSFLVFAEKQALMETSKVIGVNLDVEEGKEVYDKLTKSLKFQT